MTEFASTLNSPAEERALLTALVEKFEAVDVTGLSAWERARAVHSRTAAGLAEGVATSGSAHGRPRPNSSPEAVVRGAPASPSASSAIQSPLFEEAA